MTTIPAADSIDWSSIESISDLHRAMFATQVDDPTDTLVIATSNRTIAIITDLREAPDAQCKDLAVMMQDSLGEAGVVSASWSARNANAHVMWVGTHPSELFTLAN
jgi:hypothetical protein